MSPSTRAPVSKKVKRDLWILRLVAFLISVLLWITVLGGKKVEVTKKVFLDYQLPKNLVIANQFPREVTFRFSGPRAFIKDIEERNIVIPVDLKAVRIGEIEFILREDLIDVPLGLKVISFSPAAIPLKIDRAVTKRVPIRPVFSGQLPEGMKITGITLRPSTVEVRGAQSRLLTIESVPTEPISLSSNSLKQEIDAQLSLVDYPGIYLDDQARFVHVSAELEGAIERKWIKQVPVMLRVGTGARGKSVDASTLGIQIRPKTIDFWLEGPSSVLSKMTNLDIQVWAEIPVLKGGSYRSRLDWTLNPDIRVVRRSADLVDVVVPPL